MLIQLAFMGMLAALLPLSVAWVAGEGRRYRKLAWITAFLTFDLIVFGAFTRLTDSGLGCPDWPGCYGHANPLQAHAQISAAEAALPTGPVTVTKAWIEMLHRYLAMGVGVLIVAMMTIAWRRWLRSGRRDRDFSPWLPSLLFGFVCVQGAFGAWTVTLKLQPLIVTLHLLLGMALLALLAWHAAQQAGNVPQPVPWQAASLRAPAAAALVLLFIQIALGGWVSTNYAVLACADFPLCQGTLLPPMDFNHGFALWRELGKTAGGDYLPFSALTAIHWTHRMFALPVAVCVVWVALRALRIAALRRTGCWLLGAVVAQCAIGIATVLLAWPLAVAVLHSGGAALLVWLLTTLNHRVRSAAAVAPARTATRLSAA